MALIWIAMLGLVAAATQVALVFYAGQLALTAAQDGVHAGATQTAAQDPAAQARAALDPAGQGRAQDAARDAAQSFLARASGTVFTPTAVTVSVEQGGGVLRVRVRGQALSLIPGTGLTGRQVGRGSPRAGDPVIAATALRRALRWGGERGGSASVEAAIGAVALIALLTFGLAVGRLTAAEAAVTEAAHAAARLGSAVRDPAAARGQATTEVDRVLGQAGHRVRRAHRDRRRAGDTGRRSRPRPPRKCAARSVGPISRCPAYRAATTSAPYSPARSTATGNDHDPSDSTTGNNMPANDRHDRDDSRAVDRRTA